MEKRYGWFIFICKKTEGLREKQSQGARAQHKASKQLRELAAGEGIAPSAIEDARDADDPKAALSALLLALDDPADLIGRLLLAMP